MLMTWSLHVKYFINSPAADSSVLSTRTVISINDGLLRTSTGCADPAFSCTLYVDWLKLIVIAVEDTSVSLAVTAPAVQEDNMKNQNAR